MTLRLAVLASSLPALIPCATAAAPTWDQKLSDAESLIQHLGNSPEFRVQSIKVRKGEILIETSEAVHSGAHRIIPVPAHVSTSQLAEYVRKFDDRLSSQVNAGTSLTALEDRFTNFKPEDRIRSRWMVIRQLDSGPCVPASHAKWAGKVHSLRNLPKLTSPTIKGLGGIDQPHRLEDLAALGIGHATVNIHLNSLLLAAEHPGTEPFEFEGARYFINQRWLRKLDETIRFLTANDILASAILLVTPPRGEPRHPMVHPEADPAGTLAMPNLAAPDGTKAYGAALEFLAERYTREDAEFGRIVNWIAHNEVDYAWTWTNMGEQPMPRLVETYHRSMRLIYYTTRKYDPHARVFASFTHHWNHPGDGKRSFPTREMLELLNRLSKTEGDFEWGVAYHPYPQDLRNPRVWEDTQATFSFDTPKITMKNIEVLAAFLDRPAMHFEGRPRPLILSEQGFNTPDYSQAVQNEQAAALVYAWHKLRALPSIEAFHYHRWFDNPHEGGLKLGLRTLATPESRIGDPKRAWFVYRALGTDREVAATDFARSVLGIENFATIPHNAPLPRSENAPAPVGKP